MTILDHLINGARVDDNARTQDIYNPSTGEVGGQVSLASQATVEDAIAAAQAAFPAWRNTPPAKRARVMFRFKQLLEEHADEICRLIGQEHGKIVHDAKGELQRGIENVEYACGVPELLKGEHSKDVGRGPRRGAVLLPLIISSCARYPVLGVRGGIARRRRAPLFSLPPAWLVLSSRLSSDLPTGCREVTPAERM